MQCTARAKCETLFADLRPEEVGHGSDFLGHESVGQ